MSYAKLFRRIKIPYEELKYLFLFMYKRFEVINRNESFMMKQKVP